MLAESRLWLEKQKDGLSLRTEEGAGGEDRLRVGICQRIGYFWQRWFNLPDGSMWSRDEWEVTFEVGDKRGCVGNRTPAQSRG